MEMEMIHKMILSADSAELSLITRHVLRRYSELFENEEIVFLSLPKNDSAQRQKIIADVLRLEQQYSEQIKNPE